MQSGEIDQAPSRVSEVAETHTPRSHVVTGPFSNTFARPIGEQGMPPGLWPAWCANTRAPVVPDEARQRE